MRPPIVHGIDVRAVEDAVRAAEQQTTGEIRVSLARFYFWRDVRRAAERTFKYLHMDRTRDRNGVLIFVVPGRRQFAVVGDGGIHQRLDPSFWPQVADRLSAAFCAGDFTGGLSRAIAEIGVQLATHFPLPGKPNANELSDTVGRGR
ncbi:MAG TPA: TPM domain-containing protein [Polyangia bacterium]|nr:TPM domain-containing protein [Polyangia bacterium]